MIIRKRIKTNDELYGDFELIPLNLDAVEQRIEFFGAKVKYELDKKIRSAAFLKHYRAWVFWKDMKRKHCVVETA